MGQQIRQVSQKGHPKIIYEPNTTDLSLYFGLAKCTVLPPTDLFHSVLPFRYENKLMSPLCCACVKENTSKHLMEKTAACEHTDEQRSLTGKWCTPELEEAVRRGYTIVKVHEIWDFDDPQTGLFKNYVSAWLQLKEKAISWPEECTTEEKRAAHLAAYATREGIALSPANMEKNNGRRSLAKLTLNSMWGKFGQRTDKIQIKEFTDPQSFLEFMDSNQHKITYVSVLTKERIEI